MHPGFLNKIVLSNFQSYSDATFNFASFNYIAAPNGSGKSTIASAICLLCLGTPKHLGKNCDLAAFVKFGSQSGFIEGYFVLDDSKGTNNAIHSFTIRDRERDNICVVKREITVNNASFFYINGKQVKIRDVAALMKSLNIDVRSMTQFLAQERVSAFARLTPEELFKEVTEILGSEVNVPFLQLKEIENKIDEIEQELTRTQNEVEGTAKFVSTLAHEADAVNLVLRKKMEIDLCELKREYLEYSNIMKDKEAKEREIEQIKSSVGAQKEAVTFAENQINLIDKNNDVQEMRNKLRNFDTNNQTLEKAYKEYHEVKLKNDILMVDLKSAEKQKNEQLNEEIEIKTRLEDLEKKHSNMKVESSKEIDSEIMDMLRNVLVNQLSTDDVDIAGLSLNELMHHDSELKKCSNSVKAKNMTDVLGIVVNTKNDAKIGISREEKEMQRQGETLNNDYENLQKRKNTIIAVEEKRMEDLKKHSKDSHEAVLWLRMNKNLFKGEILEPALLHVRLNNKAFLIEVENLLTNNMLTTFICTENDDFQLFTHKLKDEMRLKVNVMLHSNAPYKTNDKIREKYNIDGFVIDFIDVRKEYLEVFCLLGQLHNIPVSKREIDRRIFDEGFIKIISNGRYIEKKISRYDKKDVVIIDSDLRHRNFLNDESNTKEIKEIEQKLETIAKRRVKLQEEMKIIICSKQRIESDLDAIYKVKREYEKKITVINEQNNNKRKIESKIKVLSDSLTEIKDFVAINSKIEEINKKIFENAQNTNVLHDKLKKTLGDGDFYTIFEELYDLEEKLSKSISEKSRLHNEIRSMNAIIESNEKHVNLLLGEIKEIKKRRDCSKHKIKARKKIVESKKNILNYDKENDMDLEESNAINRHLENLPNDIATLSHKIAHLSAEISATTINEEVIEEYNKRNKILEETKDEVLNIEKDLDSCRKEGNLIRSGLVKYIESRISPINDKFEYLFGKLNTEGKIVFEHANLNSTEWKLNILVKFRKDEALQVLTSIRQSGGEKSVSTILFLLALQSLSKSPFKLLDEINQGMDKVNERIINDILCEISETTTTQLFIITPKIVQGINIGHKMKVFVIYKGSGGDINDYKQRLLRNE